MSDRASLAKKVMVEADIGRGRLGVAILDPDRIVQQPITLTMLTTDEARVLVEVLRESIAEADRGLAAEQGTPRAEEYPGLTDAAHKLYQSYAEDNPLGGWLVCIGLGAGEIVVYTRTKRHPDLPAEIDGFPVTVKYHGPMATMGGPT